MLARRLDRPQPLSEILKFLRVPSRWIEWLLSPVWLLTTPVMVGVPTATTTMTISPYILQWPLPSKWRYRGSDHQSASKHRCATEAVGQPSSTCIDPVGVYLEAWVSRSRRCTDVGDDIVRAKWSGYTATSVHFVHIVRDGLSARFDRIGAVLGSPVVGAIGQSMSNGRYRYASRSGQAGAIGRYECAVWDNWNTGAGTAGAAEHNRYVVVAGNAVPIKMARVASSTD